MSDSAVAILVGTKYSGHETGASYPLYTSEVPPFVAAVKLLPRKVSPTIQGETGIC